MEEKRLLDPYGKKRVHVYIKCKECSNEFWIPKKNLKCDGNYCSQKCFAKAKSKENTKTVICSFCKIEFKKKLSALKNSKSELYFCCKQHKDLAQKLDIGILKVSHYKDGRFAYRKRAYEKYGKKCNICGFSDEDCLEVHHIDGNRKNGNIENLEVLCANCHRKITRNQTKNRASGVIENTGILQIPVRGL